MNIRSNNAGGGLTKVNAAFLKRSRELVFPVFIVFVAACLRIALKCILNEFVFVRNEKEKKCGVNLNGRYF